MKPHFCLLASFLRAPIFILRASNTIGNYLVIEAPVTKKTQSLLAILVSPVEHFQNSGRVVVILIQRSVRLLLVFNNPFISSSFFKVITLSYLFSPFLG